MRAVITKVVGRKGGLVVNNEDKKLNRLEIQVQP